MGEGVSVGGEGSVFGEDEGTGHGVVRIASVAALGGLLFGYDSAVINGATKAIEGEFGVAGYGLGLAVASALLGAAVGALNAGRVADRIGRLRVMQIAAVLFLISAIGAASAWDIWSLVVFRVIGGLGVGVASVIAPAYIAETSPARIRGRLGSLQQLAIVLGIFASLLVDWLLASLAGGAAEELWLGWPAWRWMFLMMAIPAVVYGVLSTTIPESPRFLVARHRIPEARKVLSLLLGEKNLEVTITRIEQTLAGETKPSWKDLKRPNGGIYPIVWVGLILSVLQQAVGINVIFYYSNVLWQAVGFKESQSNQISVFTSVVNVVVTVVAIMLVDKVGRKPLLLVGSAGMAVTLATMAICFGTADVGADGNPTLHGASGPIALVAANLYVVFFGVSWGPVVWVLLGEMFPNRIRGAALSLAAAGQWAANWVVTVTFPKLSSTLGLAYGLYTAFAVISLFFVFRFVHETKGRTLESMGTD
ncbi:sugar porter family MFS transporter [Tsukamurella sp. 8F]|uniref:sugar porter family MFS transporter n=1 Tax=unclassified Tsukamurella TaxID=2633480 RepID=UPI0023B8B375|nr:MULTISPECIES: sugar porter family MFS transporter [unclassified Tsukamurella]MDF0530557.1 sugar porter family MFS transporter [Tsukamurella sp. 8J]MDF0586793.1 sugar porter family MFS transporter [Tsukamurella sp. 8F]